MREIKIRMISTTAMAVIMAAGLLSPDDIAIYTIKVDADAGKTMHEMKLDSAGKFSDEWPEGFFPERL